MMKFNDLGNDVLQLKEAFLSDYPDIVRRSLVMSAERMKESGLITNETLVLLENNSITFDEFKTFCLKDENLLKSKETLIQAYEEKRIALSQLLNDTLEQHKIHSYSYLKKDSIVFVKTFYFGHEEAIQYFGFEKENCRKMFEPHGFIFQFTALRFPKVLKDFIKQSSPTTLFNLNSTPVFYVKEARSFAIDFILEIKIDTFEHYSNEELSAPIIEVVESIGDYVYKQIPYHEEFDSTVRQKQRYGFNLFKKDDSTKATTQSEESATTDEGELDEPINMPVSDENLINKQEPSIIELEEEEEEKNTDTEYNKSSFSEESREIDFDDLSIDINMDDIDINIDVNGIDIPDEIEFDL